MVQWQYRLACLSAWTATWKLGTSSPAHTSVESSASHRTKAWPAACKSSLLMNTKPRTKLRNATFCCSDVQTAEKKKLHLKLKNRPANLEIHIIT